MKITSISVTKEDLDLKRPYSIAYKTVTHVESIFVIVELENGIRGIGAANPSKRVVGEDVNDTLSLLDEAFVEGWIGRDIRHFFYHCEQLYAQLPHHPGARAAMDLALHDAFSQYLGVPLTRFLGQSHQSFFTSITIGIRDMEETLEEAREYVGRGFKILKVKLGNDLEEDMARIHLLREKLPQDIRIRVDANQGYSVSETLQFVEATQNLDIELIEQPLPANDVEGMRTLPLSVRQQLAADESLISAKDAFGLVSHEPACGIFNIKLMKCGGIYQGLRIAEIARHAGLKLMWGCNDESIVSITAALHAALAAPATRFIDLDGSLDLARDLVSGGFILKEGRMSVSDRPGLGVKIED